MKRRVRIEADPGGSMTFRLVDIDNGEVLEEHHIDPDTLRPVAESHGWTVAEDGKCIHCGDETLVDIDFHKCEECS